MSCRCCALIENVLDARASAPRPAATATSEAGTGRKRVKPKLLACLFHSGLHDDCDKCVSLRHVLVHMTSRLIRKGIKELLDTGRVYQKEIKKGTRKMSSKSGVSLSEGTETSLAKFRSRKAKFVIFKINDDGDQWVVDTQGKRKGVIKDFFKALPANNMRLALYNHEFTTADGRLTDKMFFIFWAPPAAKTESKMRYTADKAILRNLCDGVVDLHASSQKDIETACDIKGKGGDDDSDEESDFDPDA